MPWTVQLQVKDERGRYRHRWAEGTFNEITIKLFEGVEDLFSLTDLFSQQLTASGEILIEIDSNIL